MSIDTLTTLVLPIVSAIIAIISAIFALISAKRAARTYSMNLLSQIYEMYHTDAMYHAIREVWQIYHKLWRENSENPEDAKKKTNAGIPIPNEVAKQFVEEQKDKEEASSEWKAVHKVWTFWMYMVILISEGVLDERFATAFTSPRILGFLCPYEEELVKALRGRDVKTETSLRAFYKNWKSKYSKE